MWRGARSYLDHASATPLCPEARAAMAKVAPQFGNPGAVHTEGLAAHRAHENARAAIARALGARPRQIIFTSGLTESINLAVLGYARKLEIGGAQLSKTHWITTGIEHSAVLEPFADIERRGGKVTHLMPDARGTISPEKLKAALRPETVFVSVGWANNETGVVQDIARMSQAIRKHKGKHRILFHTDAGQTPLYLSPHVHSLGVDCMSIGSEKLYGPRGAGALYIEEPNSIAPILLGGGQEGGLRSGTEDPLASSGFAAAVEAMERLRANEVKRVRTLRNDLAKELQAKVPGLIVNGELKRALPHMLNISIPKVHAEYLMLALDREGFDVSTKSACRSDDAVSHVIQALAAASKGEGSAPWRAKNTLRISLGRTTTARDTKRLAEMLLRLASLPAVAS